MSLYIRVLRQVRPYWLPISGLFFISLLSTPLALLTPLPLKIAVDSVVGSDPLSGFLAAVWPSGATASDQAILVTAAGLLVLVVLLSQLQLLGSTLLRTYTGERIVLDFRTELFRRVQRLSLSYHDTHGTSDSTYRILYDAQAVQYIAIDGVIPFITAGFTLGSMVYVIVSLDWQLALVALAISPILFIATRFNRRRLRRQSRDVMKLESSALGIIQEVLTSMRVVKAFVREDQEEERFVTRSSEGMRARLRLAVVEGALDVIVGLTTAIGTAAVLYIGVTHVQTEQLTLGELLLVMGYLSQLYEPLKTISRKTASMQSHFASAERAFALLDEQPDVVERPNAQAVARAAGSVAFQKVSFAYRADQPILRDVTFEVAPGTRLGIAGTTGAGKTTLVNLLCRFYDPTGGEILLDGIDLRDYKVADLRHQFAIVLQEPVLFATSIAENIAYARDSASMEDIISAAKAANAHDFINDLPDGYHTLVGERGMRLSGGERQRISLARAFLKDAPILILDEPTSSVDTKTEAVIMEAMNRLMEGRTTFMIAHRLSTLECCDMRLRMEHGRVWSEAVAENRLRMGVA
jgi:ATP-binding cassette subfamily B protein